MWEAFGMQVLFTMRRECQKLHTRRKLIKYKVRERGQLKQLTRGHYCNLTRSRHVTALIQPASRIYN